MQYICLTTYDCLNKDIPIIGVFLDLSKAFDTALHEIGMTGVAYNLLERYLTNRKQKVKINHIFRTEDTITCGVPQRTVLRPVLFTLYMNNLLIQEENEQIVCFADDTWLFIKLKTGMT